MDELEKMAIADIRTGGKNKAGAFSYSHLLTPEHVLHGYSIKVHDMDSGYENKRRRLPCSFRQCGYRL